jgi:hypothetical protein
MIFDFGAARKQGTAKVQHPKMLISEAIFFLNGVIKQ